MSTKTEVLEKFFAAINRNDMQAIIKDFDPEIVRVEPEGFPTAGTYRGIDEVQEHVRKGRGTWAEGTCTPEKFLERGDKVVVYLHAWVRLHNSTEWIGGRFADGSSPWAPIEPRISANLSNQFEWPVFFYAACLLLVANSIQSDVAVVLAWIFIAGRVAHSYVQIHYANVRLRGVVFTINFLAVLGLWVIIVRLYWLSDI